MEVHDFLSPISEADLSGIYNIDASQLGPRLSVVGVNATSFSLMLLETAHVGKKLTYDVTLYAANDEPILDGVLNRWLCDNRVLRATQGRSKVAVRVRFYVRSEFQ